MYNFCLSISKYKSFPFYHLTSLISGNIFKVLTPFSFFAYFCADGQENIQIGAPQYYHQHHRPTTGHD